MHLLIIGHTAHYKHNGSYVGWGTTVEETDWIAKAYDKVTHLCCEHLGSVPPSFLPYQSKNIEIKTVPPAGGLRLAQKATVVTNTPIYQSAIHKAISLADVVFVRCPGSIGLHGMLAVSARRPKYLWIKYAGNYDQPEAPSHRFQKRWVARKLHRGPVTVNGKWPNQPSHVYSFVNPSTTLAQVADARLAAANKNLDGVIRMIFVGRATKAKGLGTTLEIFKQFVEQSGVEATLDVVGDGENRAEFEAYATENGLADRVIFHGWLAHGEIFELLRRAHFKLLPSISSEGWPKVLSEAMTFGVVPLASNISAIPQILNETGAGLALDAADPTAYVDALKRLVTNPANWHEMSAAGVAAAPRFTYERYLLALDQMLADSHGDSPMNQTLIADLKQQFAALPNSAV